MSDTSNVKENRETMARKPTVQTRAIQSATTPAKATRPAARKQAVPPAAPPLLAKATKATDPRSRNGTPRAEAASARVIALPVPAAPVGQRRRSNRRSQQTIDKILACTEEIILESGADRISILDLSLIHI